MAGPSKEAPNRPDSGVQLIIDMDFEDFMSDKVLIFVVGFPSELGLVLNVIHTIVGTQEHDGSSDTFLRRCTSMWGQDATHSVGSDWEG